MATVLQQIQVERILIAGPKNGYDPGQRFAFESEQLVKYKKELEKLVTKGTSLKVKTLANGDAKLREKMVREIISGIEKRLPMYRAEIQQAKK